MPDVVQSEQRQAPACVTNSHPQFTSDMMHGVFGSMIRSDNFIATEQRPLRVFSAKCIAALCRPRQQMQLRVVGIVTMDKMIEICLRQDPDDEADAGSMLNEQLTEWVDWLNAEWHDFLLDAGPWMSRRYARLFFAISIHQLWYRRPIEASYKYDAPYAAVQ